MSGGHLYVDVIPICVESSSSYLLVTFIYRGTASVTIQSTCYQ